MVFAAKVKNKMFAKKYDTLNNVPINMPLISEAIEDLEQRGKSYAWLIAPAN